MIHEKLLEGKKRDMERRKLSKARRLSTGHPKHNDEKAMKKEEYEAYIDEFLKSGEKDAAKTKIAARMYENKMKEGYIGDNGLLDINMALVKTYSKKTPESK